MLAQDSSTTRPHRSGGPYAASPPMLGNRLWAVAALELRLLSREPAQLRGDHRHADLRRYLTVIAAALFDLDNSGLAVFGVCALTFCLVGRRTNEIGSPIGAVDGCRRPGQGPDDLLARTLASAVIDLPILLVALLAIAIDRDEWPVHRACPDLRLLALLATYAGLDLQHHLCQGAAPIRRTPRPHRSVRTRSWTCWPCSTWVIVDPPVFALADTGHPRPDLVDPVATGRDRLRDRAVDLQPPVDGPPVGPPRGRAMVRIQAG